MADEFEKATPRPWKAAVQHDFGTRIEAKGDRWVAHGLSHDDARLIVAAVNERDALREALSDAADALEEFVDLVAKHSSGWSSLEAETPAFVERIRKLLEGGNGS